MNRVLVVPHIEIQNANALSSPYTVGFPAMTAWLGAVHALQRQLRKQSEFSSLSLRGTGVVCHAFDLKAFPGPFLKSLVGTANPLNRHGERAPFIEEARCMLTVSLVIDLDGYDPRFQETLIADVSSILMGTMKLAGGDVLTLRTPSVVVVDDSAAFAKMRNMLMPGYVLVERRDLMRSAMEEGLDGIDALLEYLKVTSTCSPSEPFQWKSERKMSGWIVPIATGYQGISGFVESSRQRDCTVPHRFAESVVTLGEFKMPYRISRLEDMLWSYRYDAEHDLYLCCNEHTYE